MCVQVGFECGLADPQHLSRFLDAKPWRYIEEHNTKRGKKPQCEQQTLQPVVLHYWSAIPFRASSLMKSVNRETNSSFIFRLNGGCAN